MELNKIFAAILLAGVIAMTSGFLASLLIAPPHGEDEVAYMVEGATPAAAPGDGEEEEESLPAIATLLASADPAAGEGQSRTCAACHSFEQDGQNMVGPPLWDIVGREIASVDGFNYSGALQEYAAEVGTWGYEALNGFIHAPRDWVQGTSMSYQGVKDHEDRADLIAWMRTLSDEPEPLPEPPAEETAAAGDGAPEEAAPEGEAAGEAGDGSEGAGETDASDAGAQAEAPEAEAEAEGADEAEADGGEAPADGAGEETAGAAEDAAEDSAEDSAADASGEAPSAFVEMVAAADPQGAQGVTATCQACHSFEQGGPNKVGPNLWDMVGGEIAAVDGFNYSQPMLDYAGEHGTWTYDLLDAYLAAPMEVVPGTRMAYPGVKDDQQRAALVAYLRSLSESPAPLPGAE